MFNAYVQLAKLVLILTTYARETRVERANLVSFMARILSCM